MKSRAGQSNGRAARVRRELRKGRRSLRQLALALGEDVTLVRRTVAQLVCLGGVLPVPGSSRPRLYQLYRTRPACRAPRRRGRRAALSIAAPIVIGRGFRWFS